MAILETTRLHGRIDRVRGIVAVGTQFISVLGFPLIPLRSWVVLEATETPEGWRGVRIRLNARSVLVAWMQALAVTCGVAAMCWSFLVIVGFNPQPVSLEQFAAVALVLGAALLSSGANRLARPTRDRLIELATLTGLPSDHVVSTPAAGPDHTEDSDEEETTEFDPGNCAEDIDFPPAEGSVNSPTELASRRQSVWSL